MNNNGLKWFFKLNKITFIPIFHKKIPKITQ